MKKTVNYSQLENMITKCVGQVLAESRQMPKKKPARRVMNESQFQNYINRIVNEEIENETLWGSLSGLGRRTANSVQGMGKSIGQGISNGAKKIGDGAINLAKSGAQNWNNDDASSDVRSIIGRIQKVVTKHPNIFSDAEKNWINKTVLGRFDTIANRVGTKTRKNTYNG